MKVYYWDLNDSLKIVAREEKPFPYSNRVTAARNNCYISLKKAKAAAMNDIKKRISRHEGQICVLYSIIDGLMMLSDANIKYHTEE